MFTQTCHLLRFYLIHSDFFLKFSEIQIVLFKIQIFLALNMVKVSTQKCYFGCQIQVFFCIFRFFLTFIQILCQIKVAGLVYIAYDACLAPVYDQNGGFIKLNSFSTLHLEKNFFLFCFTKCLWSQVSCRK